MGHDRGREEFIACKHITSHASNMKALKNIQLPGGYCFIDMPSLWNSKVRIGLVQFIWDKSIPNIQGIQTFYRMYERYAHMG